MSIKIHDHCTKIHLKLKKPVMSLIKQPFNNNKKASAKQVNGKVVTCAADNSKWDLHL